MMDDKNGRKINVNYFYIAYHTAVIPTAWLLQTPKVWSALIKPNVIMSLYVPGSNIMPENDDPDLIFWLHYAHQILVLLIVKAWTAIF
jgi:hypothetical protein